ncbi:50S ribosomal protein L25 [bioreactor metagenome]|jgi:large subunit ribosomal protein L25|uniref:50S ribosomal protein L25 n=1 Tax=bioreactor metagenome TaxID=1076179 RepID=A0A644UGU2_9ZZZZ|nr:50S ribosomal protein L25/general stress protein Ctc [Lentimicrobium sp.]MEA5109233.1 50S ribosomal protein L25/general stress protein Ctc [Lentimicrobium sp.]
MKTVSMSGSLRGNVGKKDAKAQRAAGKVPCVIYGGKEQVHFSTDEVSFKPILFTPNAHLINISVDGKEYLTILQDVQSHPVSDSILHADFLELDPLKPVIISVPIRITGTSPGVLRGGKLVKKFRKLKIKALIQHLPDEVEVSINDLDLNQSVKVGDLKMENVEFLDIRSGVIVSVMSTRNVEPAAPGK